MNLLDNKVLLWCAVVLALTTFPIVYIPTINSRVFLIEPLEWEWGIIVSIFILNEDYANDIVRTDLVIPCSDGGVQVGEENSYEEESTKAEA